MVKFMLPTKSQKLFDLLEAGEQISRSEQQKIRDDLGGLLVRISENLFSMDSTAAAAARDAQRYTQKIVDALERAHFDGKAA